MLFNSNLYLIFVMAVTGLYFILPFKWRRWLLLAASFIFYMKWSVSLVVLILYVVALNYGAALGMARAERKSIKKVILWISVVGSLALLFTFKYLDFFIRSASWVLSLEGSAQYNLILPIGISFYTFQAMSYTIDVYRGTIRAEHSLLDFTLYIMFFPKLPAGPIMRASALLPELRKETKPDLERFITGAMIIAGGLIKKVVIADTVARYVDQVFTSPGNFSGATLLVASYGFALQIYCDFSGYTDIAIGTGKLLGIELMENFRAPYLSQSFREFWRRWHISLSTWLRDYLYISLGGNRQGRFRTYLNIFVTMLLGGLWHGANYTFLVWGGLHGLFLAGERWLADRRGAPKSNTIFGIWMRRLIIFHLVCLLWIFFRAHNLTDAFTVIAGIFSWTPGRSLGFYPIYLLFALISFEVFNQRRNVVSLVLRHPLLARWLLYAIFIIMLVIFSGARSQEFIYFQF